MTDERLISALVMLASAIVIASVLTRSPEPEAVEPTPPPTCAWPAKECSTQPPRIERWTLADVRAARWGKR